MHSAVGIHIKSTSNNDVRQHRIDVDIILLVWKFLIGKVCQWCKPCNQFDNVPLKCLILRQWFHGFRVDRSIQRCTPATSSHDTIKRMCAKEDDLRRGWVFGLLWQTDDSKIYFIPFAFFSCSAEIGFGLYPPPTWPALHPPLFIDCSITLVPTLFIFFFDHPLFSLDKRQSTD